MLHRYQHQLDNRRSIQFKRGRKYRFNVAGHQNYPGTAHGYATTISGNKGSFHHNLLAHNYGRNWSLGGGFDANGYFASQMDNRNNVVYNWGARATDDGAHEVNFVNNYYIPGAGTTIFVALNAQYENVGIFQETLCQDILTKAIRPLAEK